MAPADEVVPDVAGADAYVGRLRAVLASFAPEIERREQWVEARLRSAHMLEAAKTIRDSTLGFDFLSYVTGVDDPDEDRVDVLYHLFSTRHSESLLLRTHVPYESPRVPSVTPVWPGANWHERETSDMFLVEFDGHPYPKPLLLDEDDLRGALLKRFPVREPVDMRQRFAERFVDGERMPFRLRPVRPEAAGVLSDSDGPPAEDSGSSPERHRQ